MKKLLFYALGILWLGFGLLTLLVIGAVDNGAPVWYYLFTLPCIGISTVSMLAAQEIAIEENYFENDD